MFRNLNISHTGPFLKYKMNFSMKTTFITHVFRNWPFFDNCYLILNSSPQLTQPSFHKIRSSGFKCVPFSFRMMALEFRCGSANCRLLFCKRFHWSIAMRIYLLSPVAAFVLQWQRWATETETIWLEPSLKFLISDPLQKKFVNPWSRAIGINIDCILESCGELSQISVCRCFP